MLKKDSGQMSRDLHDPMLAALLKDALRDDPAVAEAPGRSERIMRKLMTAGVRPAPRRAAWAPFAWAGGAFATAAAMVLLVLGIAQHSLPGGNSGHYAHHHPGVKPPATTAAPPQQEIDEVAVEVAHGTLPALNVPTVKEKPQPRWIPSERTTPVKQGPATPRETPAVRPRVMPPAPDVEVAQDEPQTRVAAVLYEAGSAAHAVGDYETAYDAYEASYEIAPSPDALLASARALVAMGEEQLDTDESSS